MIGGPQEENTQEQLLIDAKNLFFSIIMLFILFIIPSVESTRTEEIYDAIGWTHEHFITS